MFLFFACNRLTSFPLLFFLFFLTAVGRHSLSKFHRDHVHRACLHADRSFHSLVTLQHLATWVLSPEPSIEALAHELTVRRHEFLLLLLLLLYLEISQVLFDLYFLTNILCFSFRDGNYE